jgi:hypothetical protein
MLPLLLLIAVIAVDFARLFYHLCVISNCARTGALYASGASASLQNAYADYQHAAIADGSDLVPALTTDDVSQDTGTDAVGSYVEVTVKYDFQMATHYLGFGTFTIQRSVRMRVGP